MDDRSMFPTGRPDDPTELHETTELPPGALECAAVADFLREVDRSTKDDLARPESVVGSRRIAVEDGREDPEDPIGEIGRGPLPGPLLGDPPAPRPYAVSPPFEGSSELQEAVRDALANFIAKPITDALVLGVQAVGVGGGGDVAAVEQTDRICGWLTDMVDPVRIPSTVAKKVAEHITGCLFTPALGPIGVGIAIFMGDFIESLTRQAIYGDRCAAVIEDAVDVVDSAGALADGWIGPLAASETFREFVINVTGETIADVIFVDDSPAGGHAADEATGPPATITVAVAVYEVPLPGALPRSGPAQVELASHVAVAPIPVWVAKRWSSGSYEFLELADRTLIKRRIDVAPPGRWVRAVD